MPRRIRFSLNRNLTPTTPDGSPDVKYGVLDGESVYETSSLWSNERGPRHTFAAVRLLPPCWPSKIVCVGRNYREHAAETGSEVPKEPLIFLKPPSSLIAHGDSIVYPPLSSRVDHEGELGVVISKRAHRIRRENVEPYIFGYTCINDVTARDLQNRDGQWTRAKGFDTFCPVGPWIVPRDEVALEKITVRTFVDGEKRQDAPASEMVFPIPVILEHITQVMTLEPGDLIATGTPAGISPMQPGAVVRVVIVGIGELENRVVRA
jgi:2-keto-4-pentenoate hydratase/2-oxohepta-3-ene-1,7-dioic acid hydratase in catechol pathway